MPLVRIDLRGRKDLNCRQEFARVVYNATAAKIGFQIVNEREPDNFITEHSKTRRASAKRMSTSSS
jgi:hypothetical protein